MTPVATPVVLRTMSWDSALAETLSRAADPARSGDAAVHSVHRRVINVLVGDTLIALVTADVDDAPATIRVDIVDWQQPGIRQDSPVTITATGVLLAGAQHPLRVSLAGATEWVGPVTELGALDADDFAAAHGVLTEFGLPAPTTDFGRAAHRLLRARTDALREALRHGDHPAVHAAAAGLIGLGEGLTPAGDDILTGLCALSAQPGAPLGSRMPALADAVRAGRERTGLLSATTLEHALRGRARQRIHDLIEALRDGDLTALRAAAQRIAQIGHTSGADLLTGLALAIDPDLIPDLGHLSRVAPLPATLTKEITR